MLLTAALLGSSIAYVRLFRHVFLDHELIIGPFQVVVDGKDGPGEQFGQQLAIMLQSRLHNLQAELDDAQEGLKQVAAEQSGSPSANPRPLPIVPGTILSQVDLPTAVLSAAKMEVAVGGVQVGGLWPWLHRVLVKDRTVEFFVSFENDSALVTGVLPTGALINLSSKNAASEITDKVAFAMLKRRLVDKTKDLDALDDEAFCVLVRSILTLNDLNRRARSGGVANAKLAEVSRDLRSVVDQVPNWTQVNYLSGSLADGLGESAEALRLYERANDSARKQLTFRSQEEKQEHDELLRRVEERISKLKMSAGDRDESAREALTQQVSYATKRLNELFHVQLPEPSIVLEGDDFLNAFWDGEKYHAPPAVRLIPDVSYHEVALRYLPPWAYVGQSGSLLNSCADVLSVVIRQRQDGQRGVASDDWILGRGAIGWLTSGDITASRAKGGLRSLQEPGTAYDDAAFGGKDPQPGHMKNYAKMPETSSGDWGGVHVNSGIPNKAFYELALLLGRDRALDVWLSAIQSLKKKTTPSFLDMATATLTSSAAKERDAVHKAWSSVGIELTIETAPPK